MELLYILLVLLLLARLAAELAERLGQPTLAGEILAGIVLGVIAAHYSDAFPVLSDLTENAVFGGITDLGIFFLMLLAGIELDPTDIKETSGDGLAVAIGGMAIPFAIGFGLAWAFIPASEAKVAQAFFLGTAMAITAVPVAVKILMDLGKLQTRVGKLLVSAAIYDDVISLILLAVLTALIRQGSLPGPADLALLVGKILVFFAVASVFGRFALPLLGRLAKKTRAAEFEFSMLLITALAYALAAELLGLHFIVGAFLAGLFFSRRTIDREVAKATEDKVSGVTLGFLAPVFFASIGLHLDLSAFTEIPVFLALILATGFLGKAIGGGAPARAVGLGWRGSAAIGVGLSARGAVELIIADVALSASLFSMPADTPPEVTYLFSAIVIMAVATTVAAPIAMTPLMRGVESDSDAERG